MSTPLENRVTSFVVDHPGSTAREVALGVHARYETVAGILVPPLFDARARSLSPSDRALGYWLVGAEAPIQRETPGDAAIGRNASQCSRVLAVLADGLPHRMQEIHQRAGFMRLNSRISELRQRGHHIVCDKAGHAYIYTLLPADEAAA